jgi:hypothetical protein
VWDWFSLSDTKSRIEFAPRFEGEILTCGANLARRTGILVTVEWQNAPPSAGYLASLLSCNAAGWKLPIRLGFLDHTQGVVLSWLGLPLQRCSPILLLSYERPAEPTGRANRRQPLGFREGVGEAGVTGLTAAVAHPER